MWAPGQWNQAGINAVNAQNLNPDNVDWALLAQQWIRMKEVHETVITNVPGPVIGQRHLPREPIQNLPPQPVAGFCCNASGIVGGEAPMDVEKDESDGSKDSVSWNWPQATQFNWSSNPVSFPFRPEFSPQAAFSGVPHHSGIPTQPSTIGQNSSMTGTLPFHRVPLLPLPQTRLGSSDEDSGGAVASSSFHGMPVLDAAKRKNLPAWIREGLEKMEREKQKKEEREKLLHEREMKRTTDSQPTNIWQDSAVVPKSRFDDTEDEESETESPPNNVSDLQESNQHIMIMIRQLMTEILLEVTTEEIHSAALEISQRARVKSRQVQLPLSSISLTQKLGLDQYGSDSDVDDAEASLTDRKLFHKENEQQLKRKDDTKDQGPIELEAEENATLDQTYRLFLHRENTKGDVQAKHILDNTLCKNPTEGTKVDKDISGKLLHGSKMALSTPADEQQNDTLKCIESVKRNCGVGRSSSQSSSGSSDFKSNIRTRISLRKSPVENRGNEGSGRRRSPKHSSRRSPRQSPSCSSSFDMTSSMKVDKHRERVRSHFSSNNRKESRGYSRSSGKEDEKKSSGRKLSSDRSRSNRSGSHEDRKSRRRRSVSRDSKSSSKKRSPSREISRSSKFSRNRLKSRKRRSRSRS